MFKQFTALREIYNPYSPYMPYKDRYDIQQQPEINSTLGAVDPKEANLEAEKGEVAVKPDLSGIYSIAGKKHSQGGTPLNLQSGSFIFSDDKALAFNKKEKEVFQFKGGGITGKGRNTPASVIKREVDLNKYNNSSNIVKDQNQEYDNISKNSAGLMLQKYIEKLGQVAYVQEAKKGFPTGLPPFSQNTAPIYSDQVDEKLMQNPQYMRTGGYTNPYTPKMMTYAQGGFEGDPEEGIIPRDAYPGGRTTLGRMTPTSLPNTFNFPGGVSALIRRWKQAGVDLTNLDPSQAQGAMYDWALQHDPSLIRDAWSTYGNTARGSRQGLNYDYGNMNNDQLKSARNSYVDGLLGARTFAPRPAITTPSLQPDRPGVPAINAPAPPNSPNLPSTFSPNPYNPGTTLPYNPSVPLSPLQKANLLYAGYQALTVPKLYPARQQINSPLVELARYNPQAALSGVDSSAATAYNANRVQNPYLAGANNQGIFANALQARTQITSDYDNRNVGVANQQALTNNQIQRQDLQQNTQLSGRYYDQLTATNRNYADESRFARNQGVSLLNDYVSKNQALEQSLASQQTFGRVQIGKGASGNPIYQSKPLYDVDNTGFSPRVYYTGAGSMNNIPYQSNKLYDFSLFSEEMRRAGIDPNSPTGARYFAALKGSNLQQPYQYQPYNQQPPAFKAGGMFSWMKPMYENPYAQRGLSR